MGKKWTKGWRAKEAELMAEGVISMIYVSGLVCLGYVKECG